MRRAILRAGTGGRACGALIGAVLLAAPALGQRLVTAPAPVERATNLLVQPVALEGDPAPGGRFASIGTARINRQGDVAFVASVAQGGALRRGLFAWLKGVVQPLALEAQATGRGPLLVLDSFGEWAWNDGQRAVFLGAADANGNGVFDPGVDPQWLFMATATDRRLMPLLGIGERVDSGTLLAIRSFRLNAFGQVAFQALIDRNGDGRFTPGTDTAGLYLLQDGQISVLAREGDRVGDRHLRGLAADQPLDWGFNNRAEVVLQVGLERSQDPTAVDDALLVASRFGSRVAARSGQSTPFGTFRRLAGASLSNSGDVVFPAALRSSANAQFGLFVSRSSTTTGQLAQLVRPADVGPGESLISDISPDVTVTDDGRVGFCGFFNQPSLGVREIISSPATCFVLAPEALFEVIREGDLTPWGRVAGIDTVVLNNRGQAAIQAQVDAFPFSGLSTGRALLLWENGRRVGLVGPGDFLAGGRVDLDPMLIGISDNGNLSFGATILDDAGLPRRGIFAARV